MDQDRWIEIARGTGCPLCSPRPPSNEHWDLIAPLSVSSLYLSGNQTYRGQCQLIFDARHVARVDELTAGEWRAMADDLFRSERAVYDLVRPDHMNIEALGNVVAHLHWHIIPRYRNDPRWGQPIWTTPLESMLDTRVPAAERDGLVFQLRRALGSAA
jgi:diadenosine tetraphosphate (Ap4A) HIT family hydrolase